MKNWQEASLVYNIRGTKKKTGKKLTQKAVEQFDHICDVFSLVVHSANRDLFL